MLSHAGLKKRYLSFLLHLLSFTDFLLNRVALTPDLARVCRNWRVR